MIAPQIVPIDEEQVATVKAVDDKRDNKREDDVVSLAPETITHLVAHTRRQALEQKQQQITELVSNTFIHRYDILIGVCY